MPRWEYQVIHLNVEEKPNNPPPPPPQVQPEGQPSNLQKVFSQTYLEQEFPNFYNAQQQQAKAAQPQHPALQLQQFLNGQGEQGWSLVGIYNLGSLLMMFFRRRVAEQTPPPAAATTPEAAAVADVPVTPAPQPPPPASADTAVMEAILQRLEALETRLQQPQATVAAPTAVSAPAAVESAAAESPAVESENGSRASRPTASAPGNSERSSKVRSAPAASERRTRRRSSASSHNGTPSGPTILQVIPKGGDQLDGRILTPPQQQAFAGEVGIPTVHAAKALGFRSYASLATFGTRHGYPVGLVKKGANQMVAIYQGSEKGAGGGKDKRLWIVVPQSRLPE